ncbi:MAG: Crp/Fnr family transcriptional regulator [Alphaproteobacteria bacterium]
MTRTSPQRAATAASDAFPCRDCEVRSRAVCSALEPHELAELNAIVTEVNLAPQQAVFFEGDPALYAFSVTRGVARLSKMLPDGRRQVTGFLYPGDFLGFAYHDAYAYTAEAVTDLRLCRFPRQKLTALFDAHPKLERRMLAIASNELELAQDQMLLLGRKHARERLASFLLNLSERAVRHGEPPDPIELPMNRTDIADYLGLTIETVSRTFSQLIQRGVIRALTTHRIALKDRDALVSIAEGDAG